MQRHKDREAHQAYIGIGTNIGERIHALTYAREGLLKLGAVRCSAVYETAPVGYTDQRDFLNMVACVTTDLKPLPLLEYLLRLEAEYGRQRIIRYGPRTLDLDILLYDHDYVCFQSLQIPHPRMWNRGFVMVPLADLDPERRVPGGQSVQQVAQVFREKGDIRYVGRFW